MLIKRPIKNVHIYVLKDPETGEVRYVGKTKRTLEIRLKSHVHENTTDYRGKWVKSLKNRNLKPIIESIERVSDENWQEREMYWIQYYKDLGMKLTNSVEGGKGGHNPTAEVRAKMSAAHKGHTVSAEHRVKLSAVHKGKIVSEETRAKQAAFNKGKIVSEETRAKITAAKQGKKHTEETRAKMSAAHKDKIVSAETRAKLSTANKGKIESAETRAKKSASAKNRKRPNCE